MRAFYSQTYNSIKCSQTNRKLLPLSQLFSAYVKCVCVFFTTAQVFLEYHSSSLSNVYVTSCGNVKCRKQSPQSCVQPKPTQIKNRRLLSHNQLPLNWLRYIKYWTRSRFFPSLLLFSVVVAVSSSPVKYWCGFRRLLRNAVFAQRVCVCVCVFMDVELSAIPSLSAVCVCRSLARSVRASVRLSFQ